MCLLDSERASLRYRKRKLNLVRCRTAESAFFARTMETKGLKSLTIALKLKSRWNHTKPVRSHFPDLLRREQEWGYQLMSTNLTSNVRGHRQPLIIWTELKDPHCHPLYFLRCYLESLSETENFLCTRKVLCFTTSLLIKWIWIILISYKSLLNPRTSLITSRFYNIKVLL